MNTKFFGIDYVALIEILFGFVSLYTTKKWWSRIYSCFNWIVIAGEVGGILIQKIALIVILVITLYRTFLWLTINHSDKLHSIEREICFKWNNKQVQDWLCSQELDHSMGTIMHKLDGSMLKHLYSIKKSSPGFNYKDLEKITLSNTEIIVKFDDCFE